MTIQSNFPAISPSLSLDFANVQALDPRITYTRASTATYYGTRTAKAEENLAQYSQEFDNAYWTKLSATVTANTTTAPDGTATAELVYPTTTGTDRIVYRASVAGAASTVYTVSVFAKASGINFLYFLTLGGGSTAALLPFFDLQNGTVAQTGTFFTSASITSVGNGWYRCTVTGTSLIATIFPGFGVADANNNTTVTTNGTDGVFLWGAQLEQRSSVTAYTVTTTQPITNYIPVLESAASGVARFDHNPTTFESLGFLIEEQRTNVLTYSEDLSNAAWNKTGAPVTATANQLVAPDGTISADLLSNATNNTRHYVYQTFVSGVASTAYTASIYVKKGTQRYIIFGDAGDAVWRILFFDFDTATITSQTNITGTVTSVGNGWYKINATFTRTNSGNVNIFVGFSNVSSSSEPPTYVGATTDNFYLWGAQLEAGAFATSYIPTVASQVTRAADAASMTGTNFSSWYNAAQGTLYAEASSLGLVATGSGVFGISDGTSSNRFGIFTISTGSAVSGYMVAGGVTQADLSINSVAGSSAVYKTSFTYKVNDFAFTANGSTPLTDTLGVLGVVSQASIGSIYIPSSNNLNGTMRKIAYYPIRLTNAQLQAITG